MVSQRDWASPPIFRPLPFRLRDAADGPEQFTGHQKLGVQFQPDDCSFPLETSTACLTGLGAAKETTAGINVRAADPFVVYTWVDCGLVGMGAGANALEELRQRTSRAHANNAQTVVENVFWTGGDFSTSQFLATETAISESVGGSTVSLQTGAITVISGTHSITKAISLLEGAMADCYGGVPLIHVPRSVTAFLSRDHLATKANNVLKTDNGSIIVPAPGYPGTGPAGQAATTNTVWIYATGSVKMWQSAAEFIARDAAEVLLKNINDTVLILEQWFMLGWDCCHFAIQVDISDS